MSQITKFAIEEAFKKQLETKSIDKITISDITDQCGINRMTFYYHFKDIYDLIQWSFAQEANKAINGKKTYETWQDGFLEIFNTILENKVLIESVYHSVRKEQIQIYLYDITYDFLIGVVQEESSGMEVKEADKKFIADFYKCAFVGVILEWIGEGMKQDPKLIINRLSALIQGTFKQALDNCRLDK